jgi:hypothetical protein
MVPLATRDAARRAKHAGTAARVTDCVDRRRRCLSGQPARDDHTTYTATWNWFQVDSIFSQRSVGDERLAARCATLVSGTGSNATLRLNRHISSHGPGAPSATRAA